MFLFLEVTENSHAQTTQDSSNVTPHIDIIGDNERDEVDDED